ncbi:cyclin-dependent kinase inhibitor 1 isoform X1 [Hippoglossus stenolepis]|uniref:cyclin-dependent kinase inhibitor 1 isoform X1 n=2 Tax=Hippoglossus stenolepis TaxID=195615 RepID=UPI00159CBDDB|nr:cyclin-dependent kinase inhibitor 1 isoform X1 [Hippoglossus stenolepis]
MCRIMDAHKCILSSVGKGPARRNLFGPVDREQLQMDYQAALRKDLEEASRHWGFDFISNKPLESSHFQWEGIPGTEMPLFYRSCMLGLGQTEGQRSAEGKVATKRARTEPLQNDKENNPGSPNTCELNLKNFEKTPEIGENAGAKRKQTNLTDFYQAKRRMVWMPRKSGE